MAVSAKGAREVERPSSARRAKALTSGERAVQVGTYVYGVIRTEEPFDVEALGGGNAGGRVRTIQYQDIAAVVTDAPLTIEPTRANVLAHRRMSHALIRSRTFVPMTFGTVLETRESVSELLRSTYDRFKEALLRLEGKLEVVLHVRWDRDLVVRDLEMENEAIQRMHSEIAAQQGSTYFARMMYGRLIAVAIEERAQRVTQEVFEALRPVSVASRALRPSDDTTLVSAAFLVERGREAELEATVAQLEAEREALSIRLQGPRPPYHFVSMPLRRTRWG